MHGSRRMKVDQPDALVTKGVLILPADAANISRMMLETEREPTYLRAIAKGEFDYRQAERQFMDLLDSMIQHAAARVLFDGRQVTGDVDLLERYFYGDFVSRVSTLLPAHAVPQAPKFAYVLEHPVLDPNRFGETVARNRGMSVRAFDNIDDALEWLMSSER